MMMLLLVLVVVVLYCLSSIRDAVRLPGGAEGWDCCCKWAQNDGEGKTQD